MEREALQSNSVSYYQLFTTRRKFILTAFLHPPGEGGSCPMPSAFDQQLANTLDEIRAQGLYKTERIITSPQDAKISVGEPSAFIT